MSVVLNPRLPPKSAPHHDDDAHLARARKVFADEVEGIAHVARALGADFLAALGALRDCRGRIVVTGIGKSGLVGQKISATLASVGAASFYVHAAEVLHGDLGRITADDVVLALSNSGHSDEVVRILAPLRALGVTVIAMTGRAASPLAQKSDTVLNLGSMVEACPLGMVPTVSTTAMMVMGDALAICLFYELGPTADHYGRLHPGGTLGRKLMKVGEVMRQGAENPLAPVDARLREVIHTMTSTQGRPGAASIVAETGKLAGFFTDGDLRRLLERDDFSVDVCIAQVMQTDPKVITPETLVACAVDILQQHRIDQLPVVDVTGAPVGLLDVQDVLEPI